jgi:hypothetical protein
MPEEVENLGSLVARLQMAKRGSQVQTSRKAGFRKTTNEMVWTVYATS